MRINRLYLKNFKHILSGLNKTELELDLSASTKKINIFIGRMGSCKTVILGHLQPFHSFGTLDIRNQDGIIIDGEDGEKIIEYSKGDDNYYIQHIYTWTKTYHSVKSYIQKNGHELNSNGNQGSFKSVIEFEFGIEQNFLKLIRLGTNVSNVISMKSAERKTFVASLLQSAEVYIMLSKKLTEEMRNINSQINLLTNKLHHIGSGSLIEYEDKYQSNANKINEISLDYDELRKKIFSIDAELRYILGDVSSYEEYQSIMNTKINEIQYINHSINSMHDTIEKYSAYPSITDISKIIGGLDSDIINANSQIVKLTSDYEDRNIKLNRLIDQVKVRGNSEYLAELKKNYDELICQIEDYNRELRGFNIDHSTSFIMKLLGDLNTIDVLIEEIAVYDQEVIKKLYSSDSSIVSWAKRQVEILHYKKIKTQKEMNVVQFSAKYEPPGILYLPPMCPTKECPYYKTHPYNIQKKIKEDNLGVEKEVTEFRNTINRLDISIYKYSDYPLIYSKMITLKQLWKSMVPTLDKLGAYNKRSLIEILTNLQHRRWYNYDILASIMEKIEKRESMFELTDKMNLTKNEISQLQLSDIDTIEEDINKYGIEIEEILQGITTYEKSINVNTNKIKELNETYIELSKLSETQNQLTELKHQRNTMGIQISEMEINLDKMSSNVHLMRKYKSEEIEMKTSLQKVVGENEKIKAIINDINYTQKDYDEIIVLRNIMKNIIDAVSSKEGIPLILIKFFLNDCRDIVNDLVSDVFGETIEILDFNISEDEFKIPYTINGIKVEDIEKASQGQQSIISIALSFALVRQSMTDYNIPLLDEPDSALYKHDRQKFLAILFKHLKAIDAEQVFLISHNNTFDGYPVNIIMTTDEIVDKSDMNTIMRIYE